MKKNLSSLRRIFLTMLVTFLLGAFPIIFIGENPIEAYGALFRGAFVGPLALGNTISTFTPLLLTSIAFAVAAKAGAFNVGVEGQVFLGGIAAAYIGVNFSFLPAPLLLIACFIGAMIVGGLWAIIPALLKVYYNVSEVCTTILMNMVAVFLTSYLVSGPMSAGTAIPQSYPVLVRLPYIMRPSNANAGLFIAIAVVILVVIMLYKTKYGMKIRMAGLNPTFSNVSGVDSKKVIVNAMILSGMIGGIAGTIQVLGVHGFFLDNFGAGLGINGMLAALIARSNVIVTPFIAFFLSILNAGAMGMQQTTGIPRSLIDTISAIFIIISTMEMLFEFRKKGLKRKKKSNDKEISA